MAVGNHNLGGIPGCSCSFVFNKMERTQIKSIWRRTLVFFCSGMKCEAQGNGHKSTQIFPRKIFILGNLYFRQPVSYVKLVNSYVELIVIFISNCFLFDGIFNFIFIINQIRLNKKFVFINTVCMYDVYCMCYIVS